MNNEDIEKLALANGFKLKEQPNGEMALNPYVFDFARALIAKAANREKVAAAAMNALIHGDTVGWKDWAEDLAEQSIQATDALLAALNQPQGE